MKGRRTPPGHCNFKKNLMDILELRNKLRSEWMDLTAGWKMRNPGSVSKTCQ